MILPLLDRVDDPINLAAARIGPILFSSPPPPSVIPPEHYYILIDPAGAHPSPAELTVWLDDGADKLIVPLALAKELVAVLPADRLIVLLDASSVSAVPERIRAGVSGVLLKTGSNPDLELVASIARFFAPADAYVLASTTTPPALAAIRDLHLHGATPVLPSALLTLAPSSPAQLSLADALLAPLVSDRPDGLFPTIVSSATHGEPALGLVYSSPASLRESLATGRGVYHSRKHGLWHKGATSGATQDVIRIRVDCDADALQFVVVQDGSGFCHRGTYSCFGAGTRAGLAKLEATLQARLHEAPVGSYTHRLFGDAALLRAKVMEEAAELCAAETTEDVAFEAADLMYFAMVKCVAAGVSLADVERSLDAKAKKITRRTGDAKPQWSESMQQPAPETASKPAPEPAPDDDDDEIRMQMFDLATVSSTQRTQLLRRPVLNSDEMIAKVRPIVHDVRTRGDIALLAYALKFDRAALDPSTLVLHAPFSASSTALPTAVREAIDTAYANIHRFHLAQRTADVPLTLDTTPGVTCTRFARPIARVGLYVPGGTAVLPSTALMLGVPAQVAGCSEIVLATPPRADGSVSPEVMYVAALVGAKAVLKAGGAQAVAAMAYGTESVPKVDKIFGPGNQWVTAAKMLVQNDTDALVSIDMPAGPSEVLVIADSTARPAFVAADLLSQAEHGIDSQVVLVAIDIPDTLLAEIEHEVDAQARALSRVDILRKSVRKSLIVRATSIAEAFAFSNDYAPEHLILHLADAPAKVALVQNAGSVFVGAFTPESCGDYASGTNHTLPTNGYARQFSGVNTQSFQKHITSQEITPAGLAGLGPVVVTLAECEGLHAHANAVRVRLDAM